MAEDAKTSSEIEREIEEERGALANSIEALQNSLMPENLVSGAASAIRESGGDLFRATSKAARDNPLAFAVAGAGLTMMLAGIGAKKAYDARQEASPKVGHAPATHHTATWFRETSEGSFDERVASADEAIRRRDYASRSAADEYATFWQKARKAAKSAYGSATAGLDAGQMRARLADGTEHMTEAARERVMRARAKAISAQEALEAKARKGGDDLMNLMKDEPLIAGALVLAAGAAIGALLPRSSVENRYVGEQRDRLLARADEIFREEAAKLKAVGEAAVAEGRAVIEDRVDAAYEAAEESIDTAADNAGDVLDRAKRSYKAARDKVEGTIADAKEKTPTGRDAVRAVEAEVTNAASRVADAAKDEADRQNLGGSV